LLQRNCRRLTRTPLKTGGEPRCSGRVSSSCSSRGTRHVNLVTNLMISLEWGKDREVFNTRNICLQITYLKHVNVIWSGFWLPSNSAFQFTHILDIIVK
jgi:hypothetical protein